MDVTTLGDSSLYFVPLLFSVFGPPLPASPHISFIPMKPKEKLGFDQVSNILSGA